jgi:hypothetical protein
MYLHSECFLLVIRGPSLVPTVLTFGEVGHGSCKKNKCQLKLKLKSLQSIGWRGKTRTARSIVPHLATFIIQEPSVCTTNTEPNREVELLVKRCRVAVTLPRIVQHYGDIGVVEYSGREMASLEEGLLLEAQI